MREEGGFVVCASLVPPLSPLFCIAPCCAQCDAQCMQTSRRVTGPAPPPPPGSSPSPLIALLPQLIATRNSLTPGGPLPTALSQLILFFQTVLDKVRTPLHSARRPIACGVRALWGSRLGARRGGSERRSDAFRDGTVLFFSTSLGSE